MKKIDTLVTLLNKAWSLIPEKPTYNEFNAVFPAKQNVKKLRDLEANNLKLGLARYGTENEGLSILSIIATITEFIEPGYRMGVVVAEDGRVNGFEARKT